MAINQLSKPSIERDLLSKAALQLPPRQRLDLLLKAKKYPIVNKRSSAEAQIKEMINLYNLCSLMLAICVPNQKAENNFIMLSLTASLENTQLIISGELEKAFSLLRNFEELESRITTIQALFYQYYNYFPELYEKYNLEEIETEKISDIIQSTRQWMNENPQLIDEILKHWDLLS